RAGGDRRTRPAERTGAQQAGAWFPEEGTMLKRSWSAGLLLIPLAAGCSFTVSRGSIHMARPNRYSATTTLNVPAAGLKRLEGRTGEGEIAGAGGEDSEIAVQGALTATGPYPEAVLKEWAERARTAATPVGERVVVELAPLAGKPADLNLAVSYSLKVPPGMALELRSQHGDIRVSGAGAGVAIEAVDGKVVVEAIRGAVQARSRHGDLEASDITGDLQLDTEDGAVKVRDARGNVRVHSGHGDIAADRVAGDVRAE